ncbi:hypothetical protein Poly30_04230 [Planctomycetes bacterium Poly30]|uniref:SGNH hydrolase-type esterase domain-containing protein n=1 Tax=Saltatorellus ferox TaxID=2528018 RepID=A0A518ELG5_9BACT|nr:hypothetical protein Poly30_04230 [Planctomycetes bacterium Poly30]
MIGASVVALLIVEVAVGRYFPVGGRIYALDAELLYDALPDASRIQPMDRAFVKEGDAARVFVSTGAEGFRGGDLEASGSHKRILVLGDSLVMAENVPLEGTFVSTLGRELEARIGEPGSIEMVNAGRSGYGPDQALLLFERDVDSIDPDLVVFVLCAHNDFGDLMRNKLFRLDGEQGLIRESPVVGERMRERFDELRSASEAPALVRLWRFWQSARRLPESMEPLPPGMMGLYVMALEAQAREHLVIRDPEVVSLFEDVYDIDVAADLPGSFAAAKRDLMTGVLSRMVKEANERHLPVLFVVVPSAVDMCQDFGVRVDPVRFPGHQPTRLVDALVGCVGLAGGVVVDVTPALAASGPADRYFVGGTDIHWNAGGQGAAASYVAEELLRDTAAAGALGVEVDR